MLNENVVVVVLVVVRKFKLIKSVKVLLPNVFLFLLLQKKKNYTLGSKADI